MKKPINPTNSTTPSTPINSKTPTILERPQYILIYRVSWLILASALYAFYREHYRLAFSTLCIFLTSINYWRYPTYSWRRDLDMMVVKYGLAFQWFMAFNSENAYLYYFVSTVAMLCYKIGCYYHDNKQYWPSTYWHMMLHILANLANIILYYGEIPS